MLRLFIILFIVLLQGCASLEGMSKASWQKTHSDEFILYSQLPEDQNRRILENLEAFRGLFKHINKNNSALPTEIFVLSESEAKLFGISKNTAGYFDNQFDKNVIYLQKSNDIDYMISTILHEYIHYLHRQGGLSLPRWLEEGTAEYLSGVKITDDNIVIGAIQKSRYDYLRYEGFISAVELIAPKDMSSWSSRKVAVFYAQAWFTTFYLANRELPEGQSYSKQTFIYQNALRNNEDKILAFEKAFNIPVAKLNRQLMTFSKKGKFTSKRIDKASILKDIRINSIRIAQDSITLKLAQFATEKQEVKSSSVLLNTISSNSTSKLLKAENALIMNKVSEAELLLAEVQSTNSPSVDFYILRAKAYFHRFKEKLKNNRSFIDFQLLKDAEQALVKAWKLEQHNPEVYYLTGKINFWQKNRSNDSITMFNEAIKLNPFNVEFRLALLTAYALYDSSDAIKYAKSLKSVLNSEYDTAYLNQVYRYLKLLKHVDIYKSIKTSNKSWAVSNNGGFGFSFGENTQAESDEKAIEYCTNAGKNVFCEIIHRTESDKEAFLIWYKRLLTHLVMY